MHGELATWLRDAAPARGLRPKAAAIVDFLVSQPQQAAYASVADVARRVGANPATVTRTAQALGYSGWPDLQRELRARYLSHLSAAQVNAAHREEGGTSWAGSLSRDQENLAQLAAHADGTAIARIAEAIAAARRTLVVAAGSYASAGTALAHNARLAGYDVRLEATGGADLVNSVAALGPDDLLIAISFWRLYQSTVTAAEDASERGTRVFVITDAASPPLAAAAEDVLLAPAEGTSFFPSLTAGLALCQSIVAQLATLDPARTAASVAAAEERWVRYGVLHRAATMKWDGRQGDGAS
ncbi:MurR/RpiR family transcriptional regulator [Streptomyces sp. NPDC051684]|uniref:MurR/RpiR family transcriptional regulator n=1 Tax=Streptomyces sp. NPDC051684 TaxID=3365670 RepID=UPI0037A86227